MVADLGGKRIPEEVYPKRSQIRKDRRALQIEDRFDLVEEGDWVYSVVREEHPRHPALADTHILLVSYRGSSKEVAVPAILGGYPVLELYNKVFAENTSIEHVTMPDGIVRMGLKTFARCLHLKSVRLSDALDDLDPETFRKCASLVRLHLPASLKAFDRRLISDCMLDELCIPQGLEGFTWGNGGAGGCRHLAIEAGNTSYSTDGSALFNADGTVLHTLVVRQNAYRVPDGCLEIGDSAFKYVRGLMKIDLGKTVERIGSYAFFRSSLDSVEIPPSVKVIGDHAFYMSQGLSSVTFHEGLEEVHEFAFGRTHIERVHLPRTLRVYHKSAFDKPNPRSHRYTKIEIDHDNPWLLCDGSALYRREHEGLYLLDTIDLGGSYSVLAGCKGIGPHAFDRSPGIRRVEVPEGVVSIGEGAFAGCAALEEVALPESLETIGDEAFSETKLEGVALGSRVRHVGARCFFRVDSGPGEDPHCIQWIRVSPDNTCLSAEDGLLCEHAPEGDRAVVYFGDERRVAIPDSVIAVEDMCFWHAPVRELVVPASLRSVHSRAFQGMVYLRCVVLKADGRTRDHDVEIAFPGGRASAEGGAVSLVMGQDGSFFDADAYDTWVVSYWMGHKDMRAEVAEMILTRLDDPYTLTQRARSEYDAIIRSMLLELCRVYSSRRDLESFDRLQIHGFLDSSTIDKVLRRAQDDRETEATAYLMEMKNRKFGLAKHDFSL